MKEFNSEREQVVSRGKSEIAQERSGSAFDLSMIKPKSIYLPPVKSVQFVSFGPLEKPKRPDPSVFTQALSVIVCIPIVIIVLGLIWKVLAVELIAFAALIVAFLSVPFFFLPTAINGLNAAVGFPLAFLILWLIFHGIGNSKRD
jgi:hypothetical protein